MWTLEPIPTDFLALLAGLRPKTNVCSVGIWQIEKKGLFAVYATDVFNYYAHHQEQSEHNNNRKIC